MIILERQLNQSGVSVWDGISYHGILGAWFVDAVTTEKYLEMLYIHFQV